MGLDLLNLCKEPLYGNAKGALKPFASRGV